MINFMFITTMARRGLKTAPGRKTFRLVAQWRRSLSATLMQIIFPILSSRETIQLRRPAGLRFTGGTIEHDELQFRYHLQRESHSCLINCFRYDGSSPHPGERFCTAREMGVCTFWFIARGAFEDRSNTTWGTTQNDQQLESVWPSNRLRRRFLLLRRRFHIYCGRLDGWKDLSLERELNSFQ